MSRTHLKSHTPTYWGWARMVQRCTNPKADNYAFYGGRGITVCERWLKFENFLADMGERPEGMTLDRVDNSKGYSLENCRWASVKDQSNNRRSNTLLTYGDVTMTISQWAEYTGIKATLIRQRIVRDKQPVYRALGFPELPSNGVDQ